jgi:hypothetical protein
LNRELQITIIACAIVFTGIGILASQTMNADQGTTTGKYPEIRTIEIVKTPEVIKTPEKINNLSVENVIKSPKITMVSVDENTIIKQILTGLIISEDNKLPWGTIKGKVTNAAPGHPVIIQFFKSLGNVPVHVAQIDLNVDNSYEYKFRLFSIDDGITTHIFQGEYYIRIFSTIDTS